MRATDLLSEHHRELRSLLEELKRGRPSPELLRRLAGSLVAHMEIEHEVFYPSVMKAEKHLVLEGYEEHSAVSFALERLMNTPPSDRAFVGRVEALTEIVEDHIQEEEEEFFPRAEKALGTTSEDIAKVMTQHFDTILETGYEAALARRCAPPASARQRRLAYA